MLKRCAPLPITDGLGAAIAGRPFVVAIIDTRQKDEEKKPPEDQREPPAGVGAGGSSGGHR